MPAGVNAETGITWNREDTQVGTTPIPIPTVPAVNFSFLKVVQLAVTGTSTTTITNRTVRGSAGLATGLGWYWKTDTQANWAATFNQQSGTKGAADTTGTNNATAAPAGYTAVTTSPVQYDNTSVATSSTGIGTSLLLAVDLGVDSTFAGGAGTQSLGSLVLGYDES